jgi:septum formation protein
MTQPLILASGSEIRRRLFENTNLRFKVIPARIDEAALKQALVAEKASPREIADILAERKALHVSNKEPDSFVVGSDQVLVLENKIFSKPETLEEARAQLLRLRGKQHQLLSAAVIAENGRPIWRHIGQARLTMAQFSEAFLDNYLERCGNDLLTTVGGYKIEESGMALFTRIDGDYFSILGTPILEVLSFLRLRGVIAS